jgi:hypothetical protein
MVDKDSQENFLYVPNNESPGGEENSRSLEMNGRSLWYKTNSDMDALAHEIRYNDNFSLDNWSTRVDDAVKSKQPLLRLEIALQNLPAPGAFRHAAVALRALIREKIRLRKCSSTVYRFEQHRLEPPGPTYDKSLAVVDNLSANFDAELTMLYWLAAVWSFTKHEEITYSAEIYALLEIMPASVFKSLPFSYKELGYEKFELLTKTDSKWLSEAWGTPDSHKTLNQLYPDVFEEYQRKIKEAREERDRAFRESFMKYAQSVEDPKPIKPTIKRLGLITWLSTKFPIVRS